MSRLKLIIIVVANMMAPDPATNDKVDANIKGAEPQRRGKCGALAPGRK
jgi:hypothetical protein